VFLLSSCGLKYESTPSLESRRKDREKAIESYVNLYVKQDKSYESLAFGPLTVYKPEEFHRLDSLYEIRFKYEEEGRMNEFAATGMPDQIEKQIEIAEGAKDKITYEMEHIYSLQKGKDLSIFHDYFMLTENDSISIHDPFYSYQIPLSLKEMQLNYLFELHFLTPSERYILDEELNFILFFKQREQELIESERDLSTFMSHTLSLMEIARLTGSLDFVDLTKAIANRYIKSRYQSTVVEYFGPLIVKEDDNGQVEEYRLLVQFRAVLDDEEVQMRSELNFSRYLVPTNIFDEKL
jgi:hypothetical protein